MLGERVLFLEAPHLAADAHESYGQPRISSETATLFSHCVRAIDKGTTVGAHGLPLIGTGGWNDGLNRVDAGGRGESTWLRFFLHAVLTEFAPLCRGTGLYKTEPCVMAADVYVSARTRAASWPEYSIQWTFLDTRYDITVSNPTGRSRRVGNATLDGAATDAAAIPINDGATHDVRIVLGDAPEPVRRPLDSRRQQAVSTIEHDNLGR